MSLYKNRYRVESARLRGFDYSMEGTYFITICTKKREVFFGSVRDKNLELSWEGRIADEYWRAIPQHYPGVLLDAYVIMPNHVHGIIILQRDPVETGHAPSLTNVPTYSAETGHAPSLRKRPTVGNVVGSYKSAVKKKIREEGGNDFDWQLRFYDRIIRDERPLKEVRRYIIENPRKW